MPEKSGIDVTLCATSLAAPAWAAASCAKADVAAANVTNKRKFRRLCMPNSLQWFIAQRLRRGTNCVADDTPLPH